MALRVGVVGCTSIGIRHALGLVGDERAVLVAGCDDEYALQVSGSSDIQDPRGKFFEEYKGDFPGLTMYADHREMLEKEHLDIVTVGTSDHRHAEIVVNAANARVKGIFCEKPLSTNVADTDRMLAACKKNGTILSVDHTRRFTPLWRFAKEELLDKGAIGEVQWIIGRLQGNRAMMFRNGTHVIDAMLWMAGCDEGNRPEWVMADFEKGYEDFDAYGNRGMDGGKDPSLEPATNGYISFSNGVKAIFMGGSKMTPAPKMGVEVVGTTGRLLLDDTGDGRSATGEWTGEYRRVGTIWRGEVMEEFRATERFVESITADNPREPGQPLPGISCGVRDLVGVLTEGNKIVSPPTTAQHGECVVCHLRVDGAARAAWIACCIREVSCPVVPAALPQMLNSFP
jgi:predicted dehydrogenase